MNVIILRVSSLFQNPAQVALAGYQEGFLKSSENTFNFIEASKKIVYKKFITISSTGAYGRTTRQESYLDESSNIVPMFTEEDPYPGDEVDIRTANIIRIMNRIRLNDIETN